MWLYFDSLQELHLNACQLKKQSVDIMDVLTLRNNPRRNLLPNLKVFSIEILIGSGRGIPQMLRSRCSGAHQGGGLHDEAYQMMRIGLEKAVLRMEELICEG
ncbi:hypothetical protein AN958_09213 [Leucoagaricus sp. SymC.cos]|nr:hypothetical protein AN958_09213 [Leucoagaricus sp. SymC.cos]